MPTAPTSHDAPAQLRHLARAARAHRDHGYRSGKLRSSDGGHIDVWPVGITQDRGQALFDICRRARSTSLLEIGLGLGFSASFLLEAALLNAADARDSDSSMVNTHGAPRPPRLTSIDPCEASLSRNAGLLHLHDAGLAEFHELIDDISQVAMPRMLTAGARFDLVFVDGDHRFDAAFVDTFFAIRLAPSGLVILDDAWMPSVAKASRFFTSNGLCDLAQVFESGGKHRLHVLRVRPDHNDRPWDHFVDF